jgi:perosamine synthetase
MTLPRSVFLPFALPDTDDSEARAIADVLKSGWVTTGPKAKEFEERFAQAVGARHAVAVSSCTAAMHLALEAIGLQSGDEVITSPYTFAATAEVVRYFNAKPVFVDVDATTLNLSVDQVESAVTPRTRAMIPVHYAGLPANLDPILLLARRHSLRVVEDAAHAFPSAYHGRPIGSIGDLTCFSFYATKAITTGEGGMVTTDSPEFADRCRVMSLHGISKDAWKRYTAEGSWYYEIIAPGYKYNMTDLAAAMGLVQLEKAERMRQRREMIAERYHSAFRGRAELQIPAGQPDCKHAWHLYALRLNLNHLQIDRAQFVQELRKRSIGASVHFIPLHCHPYYRETYGYRPEDFPVAWREYRREVSMPIYSRMTDQDIDDVIAAVLEIIDAHRA